LLVRFAGNFLREKKEDIEPLSKKDTSPVVLEPVNLKLQIKKTKTGIGAN